MTNKEMQKKLDTKKWIDGVVIGKDPCGNYEYCSFCNKAASTPCAKSYNKYHRHKGVTHEHEEV